MTLNEENTGDGELDEIFDMYDRRNVIGVPPTKLDRPEAKAAIKKYAAQEATKAQRQLLKELMEEMPDREMMQESGDDLWTWNDCLDQVKSVIQNKLEGLS